MRRAALGRKQEVVQVTDEERAHRRTRIGCGTGAARPLTHARLLLKADQSAAGPGWPDTLIAGAVAVHPATVARVRQPSTRGGMAAALTAKTPDRAYRRTFDGAQDAHRVARACRTPPPGQRRWTRRLLAEYLVAREQVATVSHETVRHTFKQTTARRG